MNKKPTKREETEITIPSYRGNPLAEVRRIQKDHEILESRFDYDKNIYVKVRRK